MAFHPELDLAGVRPASYNPRRIDPATFAALKASIETLGFIKPIVVTTDGLLVAGHQRTRAAKELGIDHAPAYVLNQVAEADEIRFNQLHNGCEIDVTTAPITVPGGAEPWATVNPQAISGPIRGESNAAERQEMMRLMVKYGAFSGAVATTDGAVISGQQYAICCRILGIPLLVRRVSEGQADAVKASLGRQYGEYCYENLPRTTWAQSLAQMTRLEGTGQLKSSLYEKIVLPAITKTDRVLDFGCGKGAYVARLKRDGYDIRGLEFFQRDGHAIDVAAVQSNISEVLRSIEVDGLFDVVVCDSVLNSVDSRQAEGDVLATVCAMTRPGGRIMISGRSRESVERRVNQTKVTDPTRRYVEFLDADGFTAIYRHGVWHYQRFHTLSEVERILGAYIGAGTITAGDRASKVKDKLAANVWQISGVKTVDLPADAEAAIYREFELPIPSGTLGRGEDAVSALRAAWSKY